MSRRTAIGIDLGARLLKAAFIDAGVVTTLRLERGGSDDERGLRRLAAALRLRGVGAGAVGLVAPNAMAQSAVVDVPRKGSAAPRDAIAASEFCRQQGVAEGSCELSIADLPESARNAAGESAMVVGVDRSKIESLCHAGHSSGLDIAWVAAPSEALQRGISCDAGEGVRVIVDLGWDELRVVLSIGDSMFLSRSSDTLGVRTVIEEIADQRGCESECIEAALLQAEPSPELLASVRGPLSRWGRGVSEDVRAAMGYSLHRYPHADFLPIELVGGAAESIQLVRSIEGTATFSIAPVSEHACSAAAVGASRLVLGAGRSEGSAAA